MANNPPGFQAFVEKVLLHYQLVDEAKLAHIRKSIVQQPAADILELLVASRTITENQSRSIREKYEDLVSKQKGKEVATPPPDAVSSKTMGNETAIMSIIKEAQSKQASDLHLQIGQKPFIRRYGNLITLDAPELNAESASAMFSGLLSADQQKKLTEAQALDFCIESEAWRYRCCLVEQQNGLECSIRLIPDQIPAYEELGLPPEFLQLMEYTEGLVLITGPSGCGKSTTLASIVDLLNDTRDSHIITLEEPIEYVFKSRSAHISQREVGLHTQSYAAALRAALREDPDIIVVGELRDQETTSLAVTAAETGHLVFATLHTVSAAQTIYRLLDFFPPNQRNQIRAMVSESLHGILCQQLIPKQDGSGMALATEVLFMVTAIANLVREDKLFQIPNMIQISSKFGMHLMDDSLKQLVSNHIISETDAYFAANKKDNFKNAAPASSPSGQKESA